MAWGWIAVYVVVPVLMVVAYRDQRRVGPRRPAADRAPGAGARRPSSGWPRCCSGSGAALLVAPGWADAAWPWTLTPLTGRAVGAWLVGLGVAAAHARWLDDRPSLRPLAVTGVLFGVLQGLAALRYGDELDGGIRTVAFGAVIVVLAAVSAWALWAPRPAPAA